jgi:transcriptional regulator with XRE-family HTH domain
VAAAIVRAAGTRTTQEQLAQRLSTNQGNIARLERSHSQATVRTLKRFAAATGSLSIFRPRRLRELSVRQESDHCDGDCSHDAIRHPRETKGLD